MRARRGNTSRREIGTKRWKDLRIKILNRDGWVCWICQGEADQVDHITPRSKGGDIFDQDNLAAICGRCNRAKGGRFFNSTATPPANPLERLQVIEKMLALNLITVEQARAMVFFILSPF